MARGVRWAVGGVVVFSLLLVAGVSGLVTAVAWSQLQDDGWFAATTAPGPGAFAEPVTTEAEVLDLDVEPVGDGTALRSADVRWTTPDGDTEVTYLDLGEGDVDDPGLPAVGDTVEVVYDASDPTWLVRPDDPVLSGDLSGFDGQPLGSVEDQRSAAESLVRRTGTLTVAALVAALAAAALTVVAARRAPAPQPARWEG